MNGLSSKSGSRCDDVCAAVVTYNPDIEQLARNLNAVDGQVAKVVVIDNASNSYLRDEIALTTVRTAQKAVFVPQIVNGGLGAAHNCGFAEARKLGLKFVLLLDQDSEVAPDMVTRLRQVFNCEARSKNIAAAGPCYIDVETGHRSQFVRVDRFGLELCERSSVLEQQIDADFIVSSGSLIPLSMLDQVGPVDEDLFIDFVDTEWCFRARAKGKRIVGVWDASMNHSLGEGRVKFWFPFRWRNVPVHKPFRYYYIMRNTLLLMRRSYLPWRLRCILLLRSVKLAAFLMIVPGQRVERLQMIFRGLYHGVVGKTGRLVQ